MLGIVALADNITGSSHASAEQDTAGESQNDAEISDEGNILYIDQATVHTPDTQNIVVAAGETDRQVQSAVLYCHNEELNSDFEIESAKVADQAMLFTEDYDSVKSDLTVTLLKCVYQYTVAGTDAVQEAVIEFSDSETDTSYLVTNTPAASENAESATDMTAYAISDDGTFTKADSIEDALSQAGADQSTIQDNNKAESEQTIKADDGSSMDVTRSANTASLLTTSENSGASVLTASSSTTGKLVVALDPGHDSAHAGASANGLKEYELNLKVALACKAELETYSGVTVYMTRTSNACPYPGTTSSADNTDRVKAAVAAGADVYVAIHMNSAGASAEGALVLVQNSNWRPAVASTGTNLGNNILTQLAKLGLKNRGTQTKDSDNGSTYEDGSTADYFTIPELCKENNIPGIIVEHAFLTNDQDAAFLSDDSNLTSLGVADATGIANQYGLKKGSSYVTVSNRNDFDGTFHITASGLDKGASVKASVRGEGQSPVSLTMTETSSGVYEVDDSKGNHSDFTGKYYVEIYYSGNSQAVCDTSFTLYDSSASVSSEIADQTATLTSRADITNPSSDIAAVYFATWHYPNGSDMRWFTGTRSGNSWVSTVDMSDYFSAYGDYDVHVYVKLTDGTMIRVGMIGVTVDAPSVSGVSIGNTDVSDGSFEVIVSGVNAPTGVASVQVPVWSASDQSDICWYNAVRQSDGTYKVTVDPANHDYHSGTYIIHVYLTDGLGVRSFMTSATNNVEILPCSVTAAAGDSLGATYKLKACGTAVTGNYGAALFAVWSDEGGQDDIHWYWASSTTGSFSYTMSVKDHRSYGVYNVHAYTLTGTTFHFMGSTTFTVERPSITGIDVGGPDPATGDFDVTLSGISSSSGITRIQVPVWSMSDQSDIYWYDAARQSDGTYKVTVDPANHDFNSGTYEIHVYLTDGIGIRSFMIGTTKDVEVSSCSVTAAPGDSLGATYKLKASGPALTGNYGAALFAVWSDEGGQDDIQWYWASSSTGSFSRVMSVKDHKSYGVYNVHAYTLTGTTFHFMGSTTFTVDPPAITSISVGEPDASTGKFDVILSGINAPTGLAKIQVPVWSAAGQSDIYWYEAAPQSDGTYKVTVDLANHNYNAGTYNIHVYLTDSLGDRSFMIGTTKEVNITSCTVTASAGDSLGSIYNLKASGPAVTGNYDAALFAVWSDEGGQDDIQWYWATSSTGVFRYTMNVKEHQSYGVYNVHAYTLTGTRFRFMGSTTFTVKQPSISDVTVQDYDENSGTFKVLIEGAAADSGVSTVQVPIWSAGDQSNIRWYTAASQGNGEYLVNADLAYHDYKTGTYQIHVYLTDRIGISSFMGSTTLNVTTVPLHPIMGSSIATTKQLVDYYNKNSPIGYPSAALTAGGASTIEEFCRIYSEEASAEGVRVEVAFAQAMLETGYLQFGGDVKISQYNFAGLGATGNGVSGNKFTDVRTGVRAQIQHLKCYASSDALNQPCVDQRWYEGLRNKAPYVEWLGIPNNPYGTGWASSASYGSNIIKLMNQILASD